MENINASEFCRFFEFSLVPAPQNPFLQDPYAAKYIVTDNQGVFSNRYIDTVDELHGCFDSMLPDYIDSYIEEEGFIYAAGKSQDYYEQAKDWIENEASWLKDEMVYRVICALASMGRTITDDVGNAA